MCALPQRHSWLNINVFYNINTVFKYSTKKKDLNPKMKMGTNSFGVHIVKPNNYLFDEYADSYL